jgi:NADH-quinone oxidoreductase subunit E
MAQTPQLSGQANARIDFFLSRYPTRQAALLPVLTLVQREFGHLSTDLLELVASRLGLPPIQVSEAATFYTMYRHEAKGKHCIYLCTNIGCFLRGSDALLDHLKKKLGIEVGQTTADGRFSLFSVECLAACDHGPMAQIDDDYHDDLTPESVDRLLEKLP